MAAVGSTTAISPISDRRESSGIIADSWVLSMRKDIGIHHQLSAIIPEDSRLSEIGEMAVVDPTAATNPILHDAVAYAGIAQNAYDGKL